MKRKILLLTGMLMVLGLARLQAAVIDFNGYAAYTVLSGNNVVSPDFDISSVAGWDVIALVGPLGDMSAAEWPAGNQPRSAFRVDFDIPNVNSVSVDLGDYAFPPGDSEDIYLQAFDAANNLLAGDADFLDPLHVGFLNLSVNAAGIDHVIFGGREDSVGTINSVYFDNFTYLTGTDDNGNGKVPDAGASIGLLALALVALSAVRRPAV